MNRWAPWLIALAALIFLYLIRAMLPPFIIAIILAYILVPGVDALAERFRVRRILIVAALYFLFVILLGALLGWLRPTLMLEMRSLRRDSVEVVQRALVQLTGGEQFDIFGNVFQAQDLARAIVDQVRQTFNSPTSALQFVRALFERLADFFLILISLFYLLLDWESLVAFAFRFVPVAARPRAKVLAESIHRILGQYLRGQLILILFVAAITWIALRFFFNVPFSLPIAITTGFLEIIPLVGPVLAAGIAAISALSKGGVNLAIAVIVFYTLLRQIEDQLIAPNVLGRAVNLHPLAAIFAVLAGGLLAGPLGLVLGVPAAAAIQVVLDTVQAPVTPEQLPTSEQPGENDR